MITEQLFETILISPIRSNANKLYIVSGYASPMMFVSYQDKLKKEFGKKTRDNIKIDLIIGMCRSDGISKYYHSSFQKLVDEYNNFKCYYLCEGTRLHSKVYGWFTDNDPIVGYTGSANFSQTAYFGQQRELMTEVRADDVKSYFNSVLNQTVCCTSPDVEEKIEITEISSRGERTSVESTGLSENNDTVLVSLVQRNGQVHEKSGLNWGQRRGREPNQACIPLRVELLRSNFFPDRGIYFIVTADDDKEFICVRQGDNGKQISTPENNSLLGRYFRNRMSLNLDQKVLTEHLTNYGRTDVTFHKVRELEYYMDFSIS